MLCGKLGILVFKCDCSNGEEGAELRLFRALQDTLAQISIAHSGGWQIFPLVQ